MSAVLILFFYENTNTPLPQSPNRLRGYDTVEETNEPNPQYLRRVARELQRVNEGKFNATIDVTLTANATTTTLTDARIYANSFVYLMPQTANAAIARRGVYVTGRKKGSCTLNHVSYPATDMIFTALIIG